MSRKTLSAPLALVALAMIPAAAQAAEGAAEAAAASAPAPALAYPDTARGNTVDPQFGVDVADPYRWLEDDVRVNPKVADWVAAQNKVTDAYLDTLPGSSIDVPYQTNIWVAQRN